MSAHVGAGHAREHEVEEHDVDVIVGKFIEGGGAVAGDEHGEAFFA